MDKEKIQRASDRQGDDVSRKKPMERASTRDVERGRGEGTLTRGKGMRQVANALDPTRTQSVTITAIFRPIYAAFA